MVPMSKENAGSFLSRRWFFAAALIEYQAEV